MPKGFAATEKAIEKGLDSASPASGVKLIENWENELEGAEFSGAKGILADLEKLKKELGKDEPKSDAILKLVGKLGAATTKSADKAENEKVGEQLRSLGEALSSGGQHSDDEDEDTDVKTKTKAKS